MKAIPEKETILVIDPKQINIAQENVEYINTIAGLRISGYGNLSTTQ